MSAKEPRLNIILGVDARDLIANFKAAQQAFGAFTGKILEGRGALYDATILGAQLAYAGAQMVRSLTDAAVQADNFRIKMVSFAKAVRTSGEDVNAGIDTVRRLSNELKVAPEVIANATALLLRKGFQFANAAGVNEIEDLLRRFADSAVNVGADIEQGLEKGAEALLQERSILLNSVGIAENISTAYSNQAKALGKNIDQLSEAEKRQALYNLVVSSTADKVGLAQSALQGFSGEIRAFRLELSKFINEFGKGVAAFFSPFIAFARSVLIAFNSLPPVFTRILGFLSTLIASATAAGGVLFLTIANFQRLVSIFSTALGAAIEAAGVGIRTFRSAREAIDRLGVSGAKAAEEMARLREQMVILEQLRNNGPLVFAKAGIGSGQKLPPRGVGQTGLGLGVSLNDIIPSIQALGKLDELLQKTGNRFDGFVRLTTAQKKALKDLGLEGQTFAGTLANIATALATRSDLSTAQVRQLKEAQKVLENYARALTGMTAISAALRDPKQLASLREFSDEFSKSLLKLEAEFTNSTLLQHGFLDAFGVAMARPFRNPRTRQELVKEIDEFGKFYRETLRGLAENSLSPAALQSALTNLPRAANAILNRIISSVQEKGKDPLENPLVKQLMAEIDALVSPLNKGSITYLIGRRLQQIDLFPTGIQIPLDDELAKALGEALDQQSGAIANAAEKASLLFANRVQEASRRGDLLVKPSEIFEPIFRHFREKGLDAEPVLKESGLKFSQAAQNQFFKPIVTSTSAAAVKAEAEIARSLDKLRRAIQQDTPISFKELSAGLAGFSVAGAGQTVFQPIRNLRELEAAEKATVRVMGLATKEFSQQQKALESLGLVAGTVANLLRRLAEKTGLEGLRNSIDVFVNQRSFAAVTPEIERLRKEGKAASRDIGFAFKELIKFSGDAVLSIALLRGGLSGVGKSAGEAAKGINLVALGRASIAGLAEVITQVVKTGRVLLALFQALPLPLRAFTALLALPDFRRGAVDAVIGAFRLLQGVILATISAIKAIFNFFGLLLDLMSRSNIPVVKEAGGAFKLLLFAVSEIGNAIKILGIEFQRWGLLAERAVLRVRERFGNSSVKDRIKEINEELKRLETEQNLVSDKIYKDFLRATTTPNPRIKEDAESQLKSLRAEVDAFQKQFEKGLIPSESADVLLKDLSKRIKSASQTFKDLGVDQDIISSFDKLNVSLGTTQQLIDANKEKIKQFREEFNTLDAENKVRAAPELRRPIAQVELDLERQRKKIKDLGLNKADTELLTQELEAVFSPRRKDAIETFQREFLQILQDNEARIQDFLAAASTDSLAQLARERAKAIAETNKRYREEIDRVGAGTPEASLLIAQRERELAAIRFSFAQKEKQEREKDLKDLLSQYKAFYDQVIALAEERNRALEAAEQSFIERTKALLDAEAARAEAMRKSQVTRGTLSPETAQALDTQQNLQNLLRIQALQQKAEQEALQRNRELAELKLRINIEAARKETAFELAELDRRIAERKRLGLNTDILQQERVLLAQKTETQITLIREQARNEQEQQEREALNRQIQRESEAAQMRIRLLQEVTQAGGAEINKFVSLANENAETLTQISNPFARLRQEIERSPNSVPLFQALESNTSDLARGIRAAQQALADLSAPGFVEGLTNRLAKQFNLTSSEANQLRGDLRALAVEGVKSLAGEIEKLSAQALNQLLSALSKINDGLKSFANTLDQGFLNAIQDPADKLREFSRRIAELGDLGAAQGFRQLADQADGLIKNLSLSGKSAEELKNQLLSTALQGAQALLDLDRQARILQEQIDEARKAVAEAPIPQRAQAQQALSELQSKLKALQAQKDQLGNLFLSQAEANLQQNALGGILKGFSKANDLLQVNRERQEKIFDTLKNQLSLSEAIASKQKAQAALIENAVDRALAEESAARANLRLKEQALLLAKEEARAIEELIQKEQDLLRARLSALSAQESRLLQLKRQPGADSKRIEESLNELGLERIKIESELIALQNRRIQSQTNVAQAESAIAEAQSQLLESKRNYINALKEELAVQRESLGAAIRIANPGELGQQIAALKQAQLAIRDLGAVIDEAQKRNLGGDFLRDLARERVAAIEAGRKAIEDFFASLRSQRSANRDLRFSVREINLFDPLDKQVAALDRARQALSQARADFAQGISLGLSAEKLRDVFAEWVSQLKAARGAAEDLLSAIAKELGNSGDVEQVLSGVGSALQIIGKNALDASRVLPAFSQALDEALNRSKLRQQAQELIDQSRAAGNLVGESLRQASLQSLSANREIEALRQRSEAYLNLAEAIRKSLEAQRNTDRQTLSALRSEEIEATRKAAEAQLELAKAYQSQAEAARSAAQSIRGDYISVLQELSREGNTGAKATLNDIFSNQLQAARQALLNSSDPRVLQEAAKQYIEAGRQLAEIAGKKISEIIDPGLLASASSKALSVSEEASRKAQEQASAARESLENLNPVDPLANFNRSLDLAKKSLDSLKQGLQDLGSEAVQGAMGIAQAIITDIDKSLAKASANASALLNTLNLLGNISAQTTVNVQVAGLEQALNNAITNAAKSLSAPTVNFNAELSNSPDLERIASAIMPEVKEAIYKELRRRDLMGKSVGSGCSDC